MKNLIINQFNIIGEKKNVNIMEDLKNQDLESIKIKNFKVDDSIINSLNKITNLNKLIFLNCNFTNSEQLRTKGFLKIENCRGINENIFCANSDLNSIYIVQCNFFDFIWLNDELKLKKLSLEDVKLKNAEMVENQIYLESLFLNKVNLDAIGNIKFEKLEKLNILNLDGSYAINKEEYLKNIRSKAQVSFKNDMIKLVD